MRKILLLLLTLSIAIATFVSCNSIEDVVDEPIQTSCDEELTKLYDSIDSLQCEYLTSNMSRVNWEKWARRGFMFAVDGVVTLLFAETGPLAGAIGAVGSGLYEDYFDYVIGQGNTIDHQYQQFTETDRTVVFPVENATYIDSIGYYHNLIIKEVKAKGKRYTKAKGDIDYKGYYEDVMTVAKKLGIPSDLSVDTQLLYQYLESVIKPMAQLEINRQEDVNPDIILSIFFNNTYENFGFSYAQTIQHQEICKKIIYNCANVIDCQLVEYGTKVNTLIENSNVVADTKNDLKIANNIAINSSLRLSEE